MTSYAVILDIAKFFAFQYKILSSLAYTTAYGVLIYWEMTIIEYDSTMCGKKNFIIKNFSSTDKALFTIKVLHANSGNDNHTRIKLHI